MRRPGWAVGIGHEPGSRQTRAVEVAAGQAVAGEVEFAIVAVGERAQVLVENVHPVAGPRRTDSDLVRAGDGASDGASDRRLGRAIAVEHPTPRRPLGHQRGEQASPVDITVPPTNNPSGSVTLNATGGSTAWVIA